MGVVVGAWMLGGQVTLVGGHEILGFVGFLGFGIQLLLRSHLVVGMEPSTREEIQIISILIEN